MRIGGAGVLLLEIGSHRKHGRLIGGAEGDVVDRAGTRGGTPEAAGIADIDHVPGRGGEATDALRRSRLGVAEVVLKEVRRVFRFFREHRRAA